MVVHYSVTRHRWVNDAGRPLTTTECILLVLLPALDIVVTVALKNGHSHPAYKTAVSITRAVTGACS